MAEAFGAGWSSADLDVGALELDALNPRLEIRADATQEQIRKALLSTEDVLSLINQPKNLS